MKNIMYGVGFSLFAYAAYQKFQLKNNNDSMKIALASSVAILGVTYFAIKN